MPPSYPQPDDSSVAKAVLAAVTEAISIFEIDRGDTDNRFVFRSNNAVHSDQTGLTAASHAGKAPDAFLNATDVNALLEQFEHCITHKEATEAEEAFEWPSGPVSWQTTYTPVIEDGVVTKIVAASRPVSAVSSSGPESAKSKEHKPSVATSKERLELAVDAANIGVWDWDMTTDYVEYNEQWASMLGYSLNEIEPHLNAWEKRAHPDDVERIKKALENHRKQETEYYDTQHRMRTASGDWKWIRDVGKVVERDDSGEPTRAVGVHLDIDEQKTTQQMLKTQRDLFKQGPAVVFKWKDEEGWPIEYVSDNIESRFGYTPAELQSTDFIDIVHDDDVHQLQEAFTQAKNEDSELVTPDPYRILNADGASRWVMEYTTTATEGSESSTIVGYLVDITERKQYEQELEAREKKYRNLFEDNRDALMLMTEEGYIDCNEQALDLFGFDSVEEFIAHSPGELSPPTQPDGKDSKAAAIEHINEAFEDGGSSFEWMHEHADGTEFPAEVKLTRFEYDGEPVVHSLVRDISDRKERERELKTQEEKYRSLFEHSRDALMLLDRDGFFDCNRRTLELFGLDSVTSFTAFAPWELAPDTQPDGSNSEEMARTHIEQAFDDGEAFFEWTHQRVDGTEFVAEVKLSRFEYEDQSALHAIVRDISDRKARKQSLQEFEQAVEQAGHAVYITDTDGTIEYVNPAFEEITGFNKSDVEGRDPRVLNSGEYDEEYYEEFWETILSGDQWEAEMIDMRADGEEIVLSQTVSPLTDEHDRPEKFVAVAQDITQRKEYERQLEEQRDNLEVLNQVVRHDIRNDMTVVSGRANLLEEHVKESGKRDLEAIQDSAKSATELTKMARDLSEVMLSTEEDVEPVKLDQYLNPVIENVRSKFETAVITTAGRIPEARVQGNDLLGAVFRNLIQNAVVHNDTEVPTVHISTAIDGEMLRVSIADNGPGIPDTRKETIFGKGEKGLESPGTGLGLYLVQTLVEQYGGAVWVEDNDPEGSVFFVELPVVTTTA
jgi:PAS domain S-box-containing protein